MASNIKTAVFPGSFDPVTLGHLDILKESAKLFDRVIIALAINPDKKSLLSVTERINLIKSAISDIPNTEVDSFNGLTVEYARKKGANFIIRGLRTHSDFEFEKELAHTNKKLAPDIETVFFMTKPEHSFISSSAVREILSHRGDLSKFVPKTVEDYLITNL